MEINKIVIALSFLELPAWLTSLILLAAGTLVWLSGTKLSAYADAIAGQTKLSSALAGALLLGGATSLPEIATTVTASLLGNAPLAVNNLFGGVAMQLAVLAVVDGLIVRGALTYFSPKPVLLLGGVLLILQLALALIAVAAGDIALVAGIGLWPILLVGVYVMSLYFMDRYTKSEAWIPAERPAGTESEDRDGTVGGQQQVQVGVRLYLSFAAQCGLVLFGGWAVTSAADALSVRTGIGSGFVGATLVAIATSLPEVSTTIGALRLGAYTMAMANIFGTNTLEVALLFFSDLAYRAGPVVNAVDDSALLMVGVGIAMTAVYLWGLLERRNQTILSMGIDSAFVLLIYVCGLGILYRLAV